MATYMITGTREGEWLITGSKHQETDESMRPEANCFLLFQGVWNP